MDTVTFDALTRRASLMTATAMGLAALVSPSAGAARKKRKNKKGDVNKLCKAQIAQCEAVFDQPAVQPCCASLGTCDIAGLYQCLRSGF